MNTDAPVKPKQEIRKDNIAQLRKEHEKFFKTLPDKLAFFDAKSKNLNFPYGKIGFFKSQLELGQTMYFEVTGFKQEIVDTNRTLYKLNYNASFATDHRYEFKEDTPAGPQYYVDLNMCEIVKFPAVREELYFNDEILEDCPVKELTARDHACITLKVPRSKKQWLNSLITESKTK